MVALAVGGLAISSSAQAQWWNGPEVGIQGAFGWGTDSGTITSLATGKTVQSFNFNSSGGMGGGHAGYNWQWGPWVLGGELDAEGGSIAGSSARFTTPAVRNVGALGSRLHTDVDFDASLRAKFGYAFDRVLLYGTGGLAIGDIQSNIAPLSAGPVWDPNELRVGWTAGGGIGYAVTPNWDLAVEYRYTDLGTHTTTNIAHGANLNLDVTYSKVILALSYRFAPPPPPPPMAAPMPAAAPAPPPPMARTFLVFFNFDKYNLTADARKVIEAAAASYKANGSARIELSGYTDLAGTQAYNLRLSQRRADAVADYLAKQGVPKSAMDVKWFGKEHPRVPTPDGVREPQNRRVEIVMP